MDCVFAMHVATVFETYWTIVEYQKAENQSLEQREREREREREKMPVFKDELSFSGVVCVNSLEGTHLSISHM